MFDPITMAMIAAAVKGGGAIAQQYAGGDIKDFEMRQPAPKQQVAAQAPQQGQQPQQNAQMQAMMKQMLEKIFGAQQDADKHQSTRADGLESSA